MRIGKSFCVAAGLVIGLATPALVAQGGFVSFSNGTAMQGEPYTATLKTTRVQTLADGTKITRTTVVKEARDSGGRIYRETHQELPEGESNSNFVNFFVFDPVNRTNLIWNSREKQVAVIHLPDLQQLRSNAATAPRIHGTVLAQRANSDPAPQIEELGTQTINGVTAIGRRVTNVIPAGKQGNDQPITLTSETWRSPDLNLVVRQIRDDPRSGLTTMEVTDLQPGEPDSALFQIPEGYAVKEQFPGQNQN